MICLYTMPGNAPTAGALAAHLDGDYAVRCEPVSVHAFPDGESMVQLPPPAPDTEAVLVCTLDRPDTKTVPLLAAAATLRELGARRVGLVAPYLAYMRQDKRFAPGQAVSARSYAALLSAHFDWLVTVDPHLHRIKQLSEVYALQSRVVHAAPYLAEWIKAHVPRPLIIGPDDESEQWARDVAARINAPVLVLRKQRFGDTDVRVTVPELGHYPEHTPVLLDDIISSGRTLVGALEHLREAHSVPAVCVAVHGLLAGDAMAQIRAAGAAQIVCSTSVAHETALIDISAALAEGVRELVAPRVTEVTA
ncbi:ribose-phosphate diphosphokinase [Oleiagrimonas sp. C23AA]|uniref:ribose-phosphate diphosphokinase n=1 Tax=Oleiagrimonas sp. C23AA TaxID=2719047 RepID=UPI0014244F03|nr:ribose-phosphate diphosphokinase [Oleiagrimonas sp. C23AA]NII09332.1 ribose-phosphate diphosphokinase [Oleiagrimonas sp. C23AA]